MAFFTVDQVRAAALDLRTRTRKSDNELLREARDTAREQFDLFLSHSSRDKTLVLGAKALLERRGLSVYIDWIDDGDLDRAVVDRARAELLRRRMGQCDWLFYAHTPNAALSRWCPWELGYFDGLHRPERRVLVLPILEAGQSYKGQEYLALYDTVDPQAWTKPPSDRRRPVGSEEARFLAERLGMMRRPGTFL
ncbi:TIR domain-containing protein [Phenylobacterium sp.]|uniref:TIR domain-containing protein n=1 Tax=Phenylobacterium sp. TaxID=1871053 RepID=UPI003BACB2B8